MFFGLAGSVAEPSFPDRDKPDIDLYALMSGKCPTLKIAGRDFPCKAVGYFHSEKGRANFTVAVDDPADGSHVVAFSGEYGHRTKDDLYVLAVDRMELNSKDRPKADGLPVPALELSDGMCRQNGNFARLRGFQHHLHRDRQEGPAIPAEIRIRRHADHGAARQDVGADDQARPLSVRPPSACRARLRDESRCSASCSSSITGSHLRDASCRNRRARRIPR